MNDQQRHTARTMQTQSLSHPNGQITLIKTTTKSLDRVWLPELAITSRTDNVIQCEQATKYVLLILILTGEFSTVSYFLHFPLVVTFLSYFPFAFLLAVCFVSFCFSPYSFCRLSWCLAPSSSERCICGIVSSCLLEADFWNLWRNTMPTRSINTTNPMTIITPSERRSFYIEDGSY